MTMPQIPKHVLFLDKYPEENPHNADAIGAIIFSFGELEACKYAKKSGARKVKVIYNPNGCDLIEEVKIIK